MPIETPNEVRHFYAIGCRLQKYRQSGGSQSKQPVLQITGNLMDSVAVFDEVMELAIWLGQPALVQSGCFCTLTASTMLLCQAACVRCFLMFGCVQSAAHQ